MPIEITAALSGLDQWAASLDAKAAHFLARESGALRDAIVNEAPVDTESLIRSVYVSTPEGSDYGERVADAAGVNPKFQAVEETTPEGRFEHVVGIAASHGAPVNNGHRTRSGSRVPPNPFFDRAVAGRRPGFGERAAGEIFGG